MRMGSVENHELLEQTVGIWSLDPEAFPSDHSGTCDAKTSSRYTVISLEGPAHSQELLPPGEAPSLAEIPHYV